MKDLTATENYARDFIQADMELQQAKLNYADTKRKLVLRLLEDEATEMFSLNVRQVYRMYQ